MKLIWKILREHVSIAQLASFLAANVIGMGIIMLGLLVYGDVSPILKLETDFLKPDYLVISKSVSSVDTFCGTKPTFSKQEQDSLQAQPFVDVMGKFRAARYNVYASVELGDVDASTELFFESVPDEFVDVQTTDWTFNPEDAYVPIVIPREYLTLFNYGFAQGHDGIPAISDNVLSSIVIDLSLRGNGKQYAMKGNVVGLSNRLNTILVPDAFIEWSNRELAPDGGDVDPSRLILKINNPSDERISVYMQRMGYVVANDKLDASKASWLLRVLVTLVLVIGLIICGLACYILVLSVFLVLQKNLKQMRNLVLIGYDHQSVLRPYWWIIIIVNGISFVMAILVALWARSYYVSYLEMMSNSYSSAPILPAVLIALGLTSLIIVLDRILLKRKIHRII